MTTLWLIRHAEPDVSTKGRCYGSLDTGLSPAGCEQAVRLASRLEHESIAAIYTSPRLRAIETAQPLADTLHVTPQPIHDLRELDFGDFEGRTYDEIAATHPALYQHWMDQPTLVQFPNGECFAQMQQRVLGAARALFSRHPDETIAIVAHGGTARIILADALGLPDANLFRIAQRYGALNLIRWIGEIPSVELVNG